MAKTPMKSVRIEKRHTHNGKRLKDAQAKSRIGILDEALMSAVLGRPFRAEEFAK